MRSITEKRWRFFFSTLAGMFLHTTMFALFFRSKFIRHLAESRGQEIWLTTEVVQGTVTCAITLTAIVLTFSDRTIAGRFFFIATIVGTLLAAHSTAGTVDIFRPPVGLEIYFWPGLLVGNSVIIASNAMAFHTKLPSL